MFEASFPYVQDSKKESIRRAVLKTCSATRVSRSCCTRNAVQSKLSTI